MIVSAVFHGVKEAMSAVEGMVERIDALTRGAVAAGAHLIEAAGKKETPVDTGTLRRSWFVEGPIGLGLGSYLARIGPTTAYARRVDLGFSGSDSMGRTYHQPPNPYAERGYKAAMPAVNALFRDAWATAIGV